MAGSNSKITNRTGTIFFFFLLHVHVVEAQGYYIINFYAEIRYCSIRVYGSRYVYIKIVCQE